MADAKTKRKARIRLIEQIEKKRNSHLIAYFVGDRNGVQAQIGEDAVRPLYDHLLQINQEKDKKNGIDLFLYSRGGRVEVPWRIVSSIREFCKEFNVMVPYKAHSAATMIAIGADNIYMTKKGELGPIDPSLTIAQGSNGTVVQQDINVEDVLSYVSFLTDRAKITDQSALSNTVSLLAQKLEPWLIGGIHRTHEHINLVARKLLGSRQKKIEESKASTIVESLVEKIYLHGHAIGRNEARELGLPIENEDPELEGLVWQLYLQYEEMMILNDPIDPKTFIPDPDDERVEKDLVSASIESRGKLHVFSGDLKIKKRRQQPPQLNVSLNLNLQLPSNLTPQTVPQDLLQQLMQQLQSAITSQVQRQVQQQSPVIGIEGSLENAKWREVSVKP